MHFLKYGLLPKTVEYLIHFYGSKFKNVLELIDTDAALKEKICPNNPDIKAQIVYAIQSEIAKNLDDILVRRTGIGSSKCLGLDCVESAADIAAPYFKWNRQEKKENIKSYKEKVKRIYLSGLNKS